MNGRAESHDTLGFSTVRFNGTVVPSPTFTNANTKASTGSVLDTLATISGGGGATPGCDDVYVCTGAGDSFLGDCVVETLYPNGDGSVNAWAGSDLDSAANWQHVDEQPWSIVDWVGTSTVGAQDLYTLPDLTGSGAVLGVMHSVFAQRTDATARSLKLLTKGSTVNASPAMALAAGLSVFNYVLPTNPEGGGAWTSAAVNTLQVGVRVGMTELLRDPLENFVYFVAVSSPTIVAARNGNGLQTASGIANGYSRHSHAPPQRLDDGRRRVQADHPRHRREHPALLRHDDGRGEQP